MSEPIIIGNIHQGPGFVELDPIALAKTRGLIQAWSGGGKSYLIRKIVDASAGVLPAIVIDPEGEFHTLRAVCPMVHVGPGGEVPCIAGTGAKVVRGIMEQGCSAIIEPRSPIRGAALLWPKSPVEGVEG